MDNFIQLVESSLSFSDFKKEPFPGPDPTGMTGWKVRWFLNKLCGNPGIKYLEVGLLMGANFSAALWNNEIKAVGIDNWSLFNESGTNRQTFYRFLDLYTGNNTVDIREADFFSMDVNQLPHKFNVFYYDADHTQEKQRDAILKIMPALEYPFILIVDDWNWKWVRDGTEDGIKQSGLVELGRWDRNTYEQLPKDYWNGLTVRVLDAKQ